jgi:hypothetical protein
VAQPRAAAGDGAENMPPQKDIPPAVEIAWARAVSCAFDDPAFHRRLRANPAGVLADLGADVTGIDVRVETADGGRLRPSLETLDRVNEELEVHRAALRSMQLQGCQAAGCPPPCPPVAPCQPGTATCGASYPTSFHFHAVSPYYASAHTGTHGCHAYVGSHAQGVLRGGPCIYASQIATACTNATVRTGPPVWVGGPPSGTAPSLSA